ncbi:MAG: RNA methyltransferase [Bacteroidetes bacterium]|nr:RNA methyltransferase [Bacteroidota bacterium]
MLSKNKIKHIASLHQKKQRELHKEFIAEGTKLVVELLNSSFESTGIYATEEWFENNLLPANFTGEKHIASTSEMERITALSTPSPCLLTLKTRNTVFDTAIAKSELVLVLDDIKDPGNLGTIIRTADWFGFRYIVCSEQTVDLFNPKTIQSTMGSIARVNICYRTLETMFKELDRSVKIYGALLDGTNMLNTDFSDSGIIVIGNESRGISETIRPYITDKIFIPSFQADTLSGGAESLNASIANAIICYEFRRNKMISK